MKIVPTYHKELLQYKDKHRGETCYIFGSGPSINDFKMKEEGVWIGCNNIIKKEFIREKIKYYFFGHGYACNDPSTYGNHPHEVDTLGNHVEKFAMVSRDNNIGIHGFTMEGILNLHKINALPCDLNLTHYYSNLHENSFMNHSIVLPACQFALYAGFSTIYLVGCDCSGYYHSNGFDGKYQNFALDRGLIGWWEKLYIHKKEEYPGSKIINLNPIGLKGRMDSDEYDHQKYQ